MRKLARVRLSGDVASDYVVVQKHAGGVLQVAPEQPNGPPKVVALNKTCFACPAQWEGALEDGRTIYARYHGGSLNVGIGDDLDEAIDNGRTGHALYADYVGDALDGFMDFEELRTHYTGCWSSRPISSSRTNASQSGISRRWRSWSGRGETTTRRQARREGAQASPQEKPAAEDHPARCGPP